MSEALKKQGQKFNARIQDFKRTFQSEQGKRVLYDLMSNHFVMRPTLAAKPDAIEMAYNEGQRAVVLRIMTILKTNPVDIETMIEEANENAVELI